MNKVLKNGRVGIHVSELTGKMLGFKAISTNPLLNVGCVSRSQIKGSICAECYAISALNGFRGKNLTKCLTKNSEILSTTKLDSLQLASLHLENERAVRFESHGDLLNVIHFANLVAICNHYKSVSFTLWTKRPYIIKTYLAEGGKLPKNLILIYSSPRKNYLMPFEQVKKNWPFFHKTFAVFEPDFIKQNDIKINCKCGARACANCRACYNKQNKTTEILETLHR